MKVRHTNSQRARRQRQPADDLAPPPSSYLYSARRSEETRQAGRQPDRPEPGSRRGYAWLSRFGLIILLLAILASAVNILSLSSEVEVVPLSGGTDNSILQPAAVYQAAASRQLRSSVWNRNKITVDTAQLSRQLLAQFSELSSVTVTLPLLAHRPLVYIQPAQPALIMVTQHGGAYLIDVRGKALLQAATPAAINQPKLPVVNDQSGLSLALNKQALSAPNVQFIQIVAAELSAKQVGISGMTLPAATSELDVQISSQPYFVKFNLESTNPRGEAGTFLATIAQLSRQHTTPAHYVDVRVDGRAYYQ